MLTHRGFSAWIVVDGEALPEYLVAVDSGANKVSCWIPSEDGQAFTVFWKDHGGGVDTCAFITLDGFVVPGRFLLGKGVAFRRGVRASKDTERPFIFQKVAETEESPAKNVSKDMGMITLRIKQIDRVSGRAANPIQEVPEALLRKTRSGQLRIGFGNESEDYEQSPTTWSVKPHNPAAPGAETPSTYVSFVFRYRSREFLESQGIIPQAKIQLPMLVPKLSPVRLPLVNMPLLEVSGLSPPKRKPRFSLTSVGPHRLRQRSKETRRTTSFKAPTDRRESTVLGFIPFDEKTGREGNLIKVEQDIEGWS